MKRLLPVLLIAAAFAGAQPPRIPRSALAGVEQAFDQMIRRFDPAEPYDLLGTTRGIYLSNYGAVFTSELSLVMTPMPSPFIPPPTPASIEKLHKKKLLRLNFLKASMRQMLAAAADQLQAVPAGEQIVLGVTLYYRNWENRTGLPSQIIMQGTRRALLDSKGGALESAVQVQEY